MGIRSAVLWTSMALAAAAGVSLAAGTPAAIPQANYAWSSVAMGGGGAIAGIILHPQVPDLAYIHTDVGGPYRWDAAAGTWTPLLESIPFTEWNLYGVDSIAVDPSDKTGNTVYISTGKYIAGWAMENGVGMVMKSTDRGNTWVRTTMAPTGFSNGDQGCGERLAVDPANGQHVVYAARVGGLFSSMDGGATWQKVTDAPKGAQQDDPDEHQRGSGLAFAVFDASSGTTGTPARTKVMYVGADRQGIFQSRDGGVSWQKLPGGPDRPRKGAIGPDGTLLVSHGKGVAMFREGKWTDITPTGKDGGGCGVAIDPRDPNHFVVTMGGSHNAQVFRSADGGKTWANVTGERNQTAKWWPGWHWISNPFSLAFDPHHKNRVYLTDWYGTYSTPDITAAKPVWTNSVKGIEEIVTIGALVAPTSGKYRLLSGSADIGGLDHESLDKAPDKDIWSRGVTFGMNRTGIAIQAANPKFVAVVGSVNWNSPGNCCFSLDGANTYKAVATLPYTGIKGGRVVLPGAGQRILWAPQAGDPYYTDDLGVTWQKVQCAVSLKGTAHGDGIFTYDQPLAVDLADANRVYLLHGDTLFVSADAGASFAAAGKVPDHWAHKVATSGKANDVWVADGDKGLYRSTDGGATFTVVDGAQTADLFCFGKPAAEGAFPSLFVKGKVKGENGYFRSDDQGKSWVRIDMPDHRIGNDPNTMTGDWKVFGGVFVGTNGRGIYYGAPRAK
jgi:hypothetical protein